VSTHAQGLRLRGADGGITYEVDPDFLEHVRREGCRQPELPWDD